MSNEWQDDPFYVFHTEFWKGYKEWLGQQKEREGESDA